MRYKMVYLVFFMCVFVGVPYIITVSMARDERSVDFESYDSGYHINVNGTMMDLEMYMLGVLPSQISMDYHIEAVKAQAVILRTDLIRRMGKERVISSKNLPYQYQTDDKIQETIGEKNFILKDQKRKNALKDTLGQVLTYQNNCIVPYFHGISVGATLDGKEWTGKTIPYIKEKDSFDDIKAGDYMSVYVFTYGEIIDTVKKEKNVTVKESNLRKNLQLTKTTKNGYVKELKADTLKISGETWAKWFQLASNNFYIEPYDGKVRIICLGKGNGLGLSQYSANEMAKNKSSYKKILKYYYSGVKIKTL